MITAEATGLLVLDAERVGRERDQVVLAHEQQELDQLLIVVRRAQDAPRLIIDDGVAVELVRRGQQRGVDGAPRTVITSRQLLDLCLGDPALEGECDVVVPFIRRLALLRRAEDDELTVPRRQRSAGEQLLGECDPTPEERRMPGQRREDVELAAGELGQRIEHRRGAWVPACGRKRAHAQGVRGRRKVPEVGHRLTLVSIRTPLDGVFAIRGRSSWTECE